MTGGTHHTDALSAAGHTMRRFPCGRLLVNFPECMIYKTPWNLYRPGDALEQQ